MDASHDILRKHKALWAKTPGTCLKLDQSSAFFFYLEDAGYGGQ